MNDNNELVKRLRKTRDPLQREAAREIVKLRKLLDEALGAIPDSYSGSNDHIVNKINKAIWGEQYVDQ